MNLLGLLVAVIIVGTGIGSVAAVMYAVSREKHVHDEWFIPPEDSSVTQSAGSSGAAPAE
ncbi:MAG: hypothetical protein UZ15_CFX003002128 [Chloroflexi bacterium OLB15]|nr:MAG: hypothetical protein UZ15_CFX003002128 [Chloroflexi bacterium OLB15]